MHRWKYKCVIILLVVFFSIPAYPSNYLAEVENDSNLRAFSKFEKSIFQLINSGMRPLSKFDSELKSG